MNRRAFVSLAAVACSPDLSGETVPSEARRYVDPATDLDVTRLTDPVHTSLLPAPGRAIGRRSSFLLFSNDSSGTPQAYRMDLRTGESKQLTTAEALDPSSLSLLPDDRGFCYFDGPSLKLTLLGNGRTHEIYRANGRTSPLLVADGGLQAVFAEGQRLRLVTLATGNAATVATAPLPITLALARPRRSQLLYARQDGSLWLVDFDGAQHRPLKLDPLPSVTPGLVSWTPSGRTFCYLRSPGSTLREHTPDENADALVARTSQFVAFSSNGDASVFVGASSSKASPLVLLLLRVTRREFPLCEHHASNPSTVSPLFAPNSQSVFFGSDRHGKPAIYRMRIEKLVEETSG